MNNLSLPWRETDDLNIQKMKSKSVFSLLFCLVLPFNVAAQDLIELFFPDKSTSYMGVTLDNGKTRSGLGVLRLKNNGVYVGYFNHNKFNGKGMQIAPKNKNIEDCADGFIYVGRWLNGEKYGNGRLYNKSGQLIYNGRFENDKPCGQFLAHPDTLRKFSFLELRHDDGSEIYVGEVEMDLPNGFGIYYDDESFTIVESKAGVQHGLGLMLFPSVGWSTFKVENGLYTELDNSANLNKRHERRKEERRQARQDLLNAFGNFATGMAQVASNVQQIHNNNGTSPYGGASVGDGYGSFSSDTSTSKGNVNHTSSSTDGNKYNLGEQQSYNTDKQSWGRYDGMLSAHFNGGRSATGNEVRQWQQRMKDLRAKWKAKGKSFPDSNNENKSTANCPNTSHSH